MNLLNQLSSLPATLSSLGTSRLLALAGTGVLAVALIAVAAMFLNRPSYETLYVGLEGSDSNQIAIALGEMGIPFEVSSDGGTIGVPAGMTGRARMTLAERGLPNSSTSGYELFDNVGSLGLTSFMQEVTRVRALEGEIARTIRSINGISAARVHIVMPDRGSFRRGEQKPSASVMVRAIGNDGQRAAQSIRHLVASSVPGLSVDDVTVLDSTGQLLASGDDFSNSTMNRSLNIVQTVESEIVSNIDKALAPFLGIDNFRASVRANINTDTQQIQETVFDPDSRVERSVRVTRENKASNSSETNAPATVEQNLPTEQVQSSGGPQSSESNERKEEQTNYEINSRTIATVRNSYSIERLSIAVVINEGRIMAMLGEGATQADIDAHLAELQQIVSSASGLDADRGDQIKLTVVKFLETELLNEAAQGEGIGQTVGRHLGSMINAGAFVLVALLVVWFGFRPLANALTSATQQDDANGPDLPDFSPGTAAMDGFGADFGFDPSEEAPAEAAPFALDADPAAAAAAAAGPMPGMAPQAEDISRRVKEGPEKRLARMVEINEERAAKILRKWAIEDAA
ncbi:flagellar basal-body MS-ring/collar protein FliF [Nitratireductor sp. XY-223]|uniref:flagellar basal-body MS-ring/collar protein FliF n=1 Tax=Nitratireductor sp. XY-223 TaxID=2561926 RepID=UPI0010A9EA88|nr:flagellar basal-body MS-ring/collar protein FliF [Nitratireductor sp. XY-223]